MDRRTALFLLGASLLPSRCLAQTKGTEMAAPLGLTWGASSEAIRSAGIDLTEFPGKDYGASYMAAKLTKALADQNTTLLSFGHNDRLWRIVMLSRDHANDPHGGAVLSRYTELLAALTEKYGKPKTFHRLGGSIYSESRYFLAGIRGGETRWYSQFKTPELQIELALTASDGSTGAWRIIYEYVPLSIIFEDSKKKNERDKL